MSDSSAKDIIVADNIALEILGKLAREYVSTDGRRPMIHLLLQSQTSLRILQTMDFSEEVNDMFDVHPFTMEDVWAKNVLVQLPGIKNADYPTLDQKSIDKESKSFVHVVINGFNCQAEAVAIHTALVAHYPNYNSGDKLPLRTRITIIDEDIKSKGNNFISKYQHLFEL